MYSEKDTLSLIYNFNPNTLPRSRHEKAFQVALGVKNLPANAGDIRDMGFRRRGQEDSLEESMATHSSILTWRVPMDKQAWRATVHGVVGT